MALLHTALQYGGAVISTGVSQQKGFDSQVRVSQPTSKVMVDDDDEWLSRFVYTIFNQFRMFISERNVTSNKSEMAVLFRDKFNPEL